jgi:hypothetical protein
MTVLLLFQPEWQVTRPWPSSDGAHSVPIVVILTVAFRLSFDNANATHKNARAERADSTEEIRCDA